MPQHLFLCAIGRSGTTAFRTSLGLHPEIYYNNRENNIVQDLIQVAHINSTRQSRKFAMVVEMNRYDEIFRKAITDLIWPEQELRERKVRLAAINPEGHHLSLLSRVFPNSKFILLVRNGIEVVSSRMRYDSFKNHSFQSHCDVWMRSQSVNQWGQENASQFRLFRHEWFYDEFTIRAQLTALSNWLGIKPADEPADSILNNLRHPTDAAVQPESDFDQMDEADKQAYFRSKSERWSEWTQNQQEIFANTCATFMSDLEYEIPWLTS